MNLLYLQLSFLKYNKNEWAFSSIRTSKEGSHWLKNTIYSSHFHAERHKFRGTGKRYFMAVISLGMDTFLSRLSCEPQGSGRFQAVKNGTLQDSSMGFSTEHPPTEHSAAKGRMSSFDSCYSDCHPGSQRGSSPSGWIWNMLLLIGKLQVNTTYLFLKIGE